MTDAHDPAGPTTINPNTTDPATPHRIADPRLESLLDRLAEEAVLPHWPDDARHAFRKAHQWACAAFGVIRPPPSTVARLTLRR